ncbi:dihydroneopterin aldolase [Halalkalibacter wakoensis JCM 9140]|uniref:7,8-dihydroneopterin aldolase n=1 Tax=Halalkalibacter wakoensis JCM 9140 TaxID=1236970 RepID=W4Q9E4_9BACI|nr:dihydroneopterin aldolase [Halalkalibacter wakoensis]GAE28004.1 dihydroneopterin aldolase [Halalkalibacter wakoensis JCM 9140]
MDKIYMNQLAFYGYHGVFEEENKLGQRFIVDLVLHIDLNKAGKTDDLQATINYGDAYKRVKEIVEGKPYNLLEAVAETIAAELLSAYDQLQDCTVKVIKPDPPIPGHYQSVAVEITRSRS